VLPGDLAGEHTSSAAADNAVAAQRDAMLSGRLEEKAALVFEKILTSMAAAAMTKMGASPAGREALEGLSGMLSESGVSHPSTKPSPNPAAAVVAAEKESTESRPLGRNLVREQMEKSLGDAEFDVSERFYEGRKMAQSMTMGEAARRAAAPAAQFFSERNEPWHQDEAGNYVQMGPDGQTVVEKVAPSSNPFSRYGKIKAATYAGAATAAVSSGNLAAMGTLGGMAARVAGPLGIAVGGAQLVGGALESQNQAASTYRSAFGEQDTSMFAAQERFAEWRAGLSGFGTIGGERAREQFQQASAMGLRGETRDQATDFGSDMYMRFGMDTSESMQIVEQSIKQGNLSLRDFGTAITEVSRAAVEAGRSSAEAIKDFTDAQAVVASRVTPGGASIAVTSAISAVDKGLPTALSDSLGGAKGLAGMLTPEMIMSNAALSGQDPMAAYSLASDPNTAEGQITSTLAQAGQSLVNMMAPLFGMTPTQVREVVREATGGQTVSYERQYEIFVNDLAKGRDAAGILQMALTQIAPSLGLQVADQSQFLNLFFEAAQGGFGLTASQQAVGDKVWAGVSGAINGMFGGVLGGSGALSTDPDDLRSRLGYPEVKSTRGYAPLDAPGDAEAMSAYVNYMEKTGETNPAVEALLSKEGSAKAAEAAGVSDPEDVRLRMMIGGKSRDMSLSQVIAGGDSYLSQLSSASIVPTGRSGDQPQSIRVLLDLTPEAKKMVRNQEGPSEDQRDGVPSSANRNPADYPSAGGL
jgi:hypothetical protein